MARSPQGEAVVKKAREKPAKTLADLQERFAKGGAWPIDRELFHSAALMYIAERLTGIEAALSTKKGRSRKPSAWNRFFAAGMKAGKAPALIGEEWRQRRKESS